MRSGYNALLQKYDIETESELEVGIGAGAVVTGTFGHQSLRTEDVFGTVVNETAMIMHYLGIAVTKEIHQQIGSTFKTRRLEDIALKWAEAMLKVWAIVEK
jgi:class 3 adenylate cyclase